MKTEELIPYVEPIPVPPEIFIVLEQIFFLIHIILINSILGLGLIIFFQWSKNKDFFEINKPLVKRIPILFALGINMAIPALLFIQVVFGHLFYSSSILMGTFWILIIPFLIIVYYSAYFHYRRFENSSYARYALLLMILIIFYIAFIFVNNLSMMENPERWSEYFSNRKGTILLWSMLTVYPRFLHFLVASVAVGGLFYSFYLSKTGKVKEGLKIFAYATIVQMFVGFLYVLSLPQRIMSKYLGGDLQVTVVFVLGILTALVSIFTALKGKLKGSIIFLFLTLIFMVINRYNLRVFQLEGVFSPAQLKVIPQWDVFALFVFVLFVGVVTIVYILRLASAQNRGVIK